MDKVAGGDGGKENTIMTDVGSAADLADILRRIEERLAAVGLSATAAGRMAGKPDVIRNIRRATKSETRRGVSTATLAALAPVLQTTSRWLLTGEGEVEAGAEVVNSMEASLAVAKAEIQGLKDMIDELRQSRDDWKAQAERLERRPKTPAETSNFDRSRKLRNGARSPLTRIGDESLLRAGAEVICSPGEVRFGERQPRNTKPANEGGPVSRQSRGISQISAIAILPEKLNRCKRHFWLRRSFAGNSCAPFGGT